MRYTRPRWCRLDQLVIGARPDKLKTAPVLGARIPRMTEAQQTRLYVLNYRQQWPGNNPLDSAEILEREQLIALATGRPR